MPTDLTIFHWECADQATAPPQARNQTASSPPSALPGAPIIKTASNPRINPTAPAAATMRATMSDPAIATLVTAPQVGHKLSGSVPASDDRQRGQLLVRDSEASPGAESLTAGNIGDSLMGA